MILLTTAVLALSLSQNPGSKPESIDVSAEVKARLLLLTDGKNHYVAVDPKEPWTTIFSSGDGKQFSKVRVAGGGRSGEEQWNANVWDPRMWAGDGQGAFVSMKNPLAGAVDAGANDGREFTVSCAKKTTTVTLVAAAEAKKIIDAATYVGAVWTRVPEKLLRDDRGTYYLVDRFRSSDPLDRRDFRVFAGPKGNMKALPLKNIVDDAQGMILATKNGNLRLVTNTDGKFEGKWIQGDKSTTLIEVDLDRYDTARMIYLDLGPYTGQRLGTPCDDFM